MRKIFEPVILALGIYPWFGEGTVRNGCLEFQLDQSSLQDSRYVAVRPGRSG
jgi:hypothetical protein